MRKTRIGNWIYVTGSPRSATTFVGAILSAPLSVDYIHEPFNPDCGMPGIEQPYLYLRPGTSQEQSLRPLFERLFAYQFHLKTGYYRNDTTIRKLIKRLVGSRGPFYLRLAKLNPFHRAAVIKDPIGCLLTGYLAATYGVKPVILLRHPVPFVASVLRLNWPVTLQPLLAQPDLIEDFFAGERRLLEDGGRSNLERAALLWRALNKVLIAQHQRHPDWLLITHEGLNEKPRDTFAMLYHRLGLPWSDRIGRLIDKRTSANNRQEARAGRVQDFSRDSAGLFQLRSAMLSPADKQRILALTGDIALQIYEEATFGC